VLNYAAVDIGKNEKFMKANGIHPHLEIKELSVRLDLDL
jgi:hypothetical protein